MSKLDWGILDWGIFDHVGMPSYYAYTPTQDLYSYCRDADNPFRHLIDWIYTYIIVNIDRCCGGADAENKCPSCESLTDIYNAMNEW